MSAYVALDEVLTALVMTEIDVRNGEIKKGEIIGLIRERLSEIKQVDGNTFRRICMRIPDRKPAVPYSQITIPIHRCALCGGEVLYKDAYCKHCGAKFAGVNKP